MVFRLTGHVMGLSSFLVNIAKDVFGINRDAQESNQAADELKKNDLLSSKSRKKFTFLPISWLPFLVQSPGRRRETTASVLVESFFYWCVVARTPEDAFSEKMAFGSLNAGRRGKVTHFTFKHVHVREKSFNRFFFL